jgi:hypothetical protein
MKRHIIFTFTVIFQMPFHNFHLPYHDFYPFSHTLWKLPFQSGAKRS